MPLKFWLGGAESNKSRQMLKYILDEAEKNPSRQYLVVAPEQMGLATQQELVFSSKNRGILNIDVLSFTRLAHRISDEVGSFAADVTTLDEMGKSLLIGMIAAKHRKELSVFGNNLDKPGYTDKIKSIISEFMQYGITPEKAAELSQKASDNGKGLLAKKLSDVALVYGLFKDYIKDRYTTVEETLDAVSSLVPHSDTVKNSVIVFDGFTGFTPVQNKLIGVLMEYALDIHVALLLEDCIQEKSEKTAIQQHELFYLSKNTMNQLGRMADERHVIIADPYKADKTAISNTCNSKDDSVYKEITQKPELNNTDKKTCIHIFSAQDPDEEMRMVFTRIKDLIRESGYRYRDIAILTGDLENYRHPTERVFNNHDIPFFIDRTEPIMLNPFIEYIRSFIDIISDNYSQSAVFHFLKSGLTGFAEEEINILENYCIATGIKGTGRWHKAFTAHTGTAGADELLKINETREKFIARCDLFTNSLCEQKSGNEKPAKLGTNINAGSKFTVKQFSTALYRLIVSDGIEDKLKQAAKNFEEEGNRKLSDQYGGIYVRIMNILDELCELIPDEKTDIRGFGALLDAGFDGIRIGTLPTGMDYVQVGDLTRSRFDHIKALFIVGANDGIIPKVDHGSGIINENERDFLQKCDNELVLAPSSREEVFNQQLYIYMAESIPGEHLYVSYPRTSRDGNSLMPSYIIKDLQDRHLGTKVEKAPDMTQNYSDEKEAFDNLADMIAPALAGKLAPAKLARVKELLGYFTKTDPYRQKLSLMFEKAILSGGDRAQDSIGSALARAIYGKKIVSSITRLEAYANCAYRYFLEYGLTLRDREVFSFEAKDLGTVFHESIREYSLSLQDKGTDWAQIPEEVQQKLMDDAVTRVIERQAAQQLSSSARNTYMENRIRRIMKKSAGIITSQIKQGDFRPKYFEVDFDTMESDESISVKLSDSEVMRLRGRIDRVDECETEDGIYIRIIDYKSSQHSMDLAAVYEGRQLQLLVYLNAAMEGARARLKKDEDQSEKGVYPAGILYYRMDDPLVEETEALSDDDINKLVMKNMRLSGLVNSDPEVLRLMDRDISSDSVVLPVGLSTKGTVKSSKQAVSGDDFKILSKYATSVMSKLGCRIVSGDISIPKPDGENRFTGPDCAFCPYGAVCAGRDKAAGSAESMSNDEWIALMRGGEDKEDKE